ncbi:MAG: 30S ribosomal protein S4, partial [bacterium]
MARYIGPVCKLCRREEKKLFLKGAKCFSPKCPVEKRQFPPGQHGRTRRMKLSEYGVQLREKQKIRRIYGLLERQFRNYYEKALKIKGITGENLLRLLERRLDNVVYRLGFAPSRSAARQLVRHRHFLVNNRPVDIPSFSLRPGDMIKVRDKSRKMELIHA